MNAPYRAKAPLIRNNDSARTGTANETRTLCRASRASEHVEGVAAPGSEAHNTNAVNPDAGKLAHEHVKPFAKACGAEDDTNDIDTDHDDDCGCPECRHNRITARMRKDSEYIFHKSFPGARF